MALYLLLLSGRSSAGVAQSVEQLICNQQVGGSSPSTSSNVKRSSLHSASAEAAKAPLRSLRFPFPRRPAPLGSARRTERISSQYGGIPEWPKGTDCKSAGNAFGGSNPPSPTIKRVRKRCTRQKARFYRAFLLPKGRFSKFQIRR